MSGNDKVKLTGKGKKALNRLNAIKERIDNEKCGMGVLLSRINKILINLVQKKDGFEGIEDGATLVLSQKKRSMITKVPKRIEFLSHQLSFYIDFTIVASEGDDSSEVKGAIIYGTNRTLCFREYPFQNLTKKSSEECKQCERIKRCDRLEDKPLIQFSINRDGMMRSTGQLEGEWWIKEKSDLADLHYQALDYVWKNALEWTNENILP